MTIIEESAAMFVEQNAWMFKPEGIEPAKQLIAMMLAEAERRGEQKSAYDYALCKAETGYHQERLGEYRRSPFSTYIIDGWEPFLFSDGMVIMRRRQKEIER